MCIYVIYILRSRAKLPGSFFSCVFKPSWERKLVENWILETAKAQIDPRQQS